MSEGSERPNRCHIRNSFGTRCQLDEGHKRNEIDGGHVFPIDDAFFEALEAGDIIIGRPAKREPETLLGRIRKRVGW